MWTETGSVTRLLLSKLKTRPDPTRPDPTRPDPYFSSLIRDILCMATYSYSGYHGHQSNVISIYILHYHGHISKHKTVLKILGKRKKKNTKNPAIKKFETINRCKTDLKNLRKNVTLSLQEIIYHDIFFFYASLTYC